MKNYFSCYEQKSAAFGLEEECEKVTGTSESNLSTFKIAANVSSSMTKSIECSIIVTDVFFFQSLCVIYLFHLCLFPFE